MNYSIGVDFDGTIVCHDNLFYYLALQKNLISIETLPIKREIKTQIRKLPNGDLEWQRLQAIVYGEKIVDAKPIKGVLEFFEECKKRKVETYIVSHKTQCSNLGESNKDFRLAAMAWLTTNKFFNDASALTPKKVFFESTRNEKIEKISHLKCTHFIDDLEEIFEEKTFPLEVKKILYSQNHKTNISVDFVADNWHEINKYFFE